MPKDKVLEMPDKPDLDAARRVCEFMEPMPETVPDDAEDMDLAGACVHSPLGFWLCVGGYIAYAWEPCPLTLDRLHLVEERLTEEQWDRYRAYFMQQAVPPPVTSAKYFRLIVNATADQKVMALAGVVEGK